MLFASPALNRGLGARKTRKVPDHLRGRAV